MSLCRARIWRRVAVVAAVASVLVPATFTFAVLAAPNDGPAPQKAESAPSDRPPKLGLQLNDSKAFQGYTLLAPLNSKKSYLIDMEGRVVRAWESKYTAGQEAYFLENGHLLRAATLDNRERLFGGAGQGGRVQEFDWDGNIVWDFKFHDEKRVAHHAICRLPNGNVMLIVWEIKTGAEAVAAGRDPSNVHGPWLADSLVEIKPSGKTTGEVVWEWHAWDHLIQDVDPTKANFGNVGNHPELIDINFGGGEMAFPGGGPPGPPRGDFAKKDTPKQDEAKKKQEMDRLKSIGYVGNPTARANIGLLPDWTHVNSVAYNAEFDQIMISVPLVRRVLDHRPRHDDRRGCPPQRWKARQGRRHPLPLGQPELVPRRRDGGSTPLCSARCAVDRQGLSRGGARSRLQQRRRPAGRQLLVGRRDRRPGGFAGQLQPRGG